MRFVLTQQLANTVVAATTRTELTHLISSLIACDLLILDEFGYLTLDPKVGPVLYEIIAARYEKGATIITSNKSLTTWGELVGDNAYCDPSKSMEGIYYESKPTLARNQTRLLHRGFDRTLLRG